MATQEKTIMTQTYIT